MLTWRKEPVSVTEPGAAGGLDLITWSEFGFKRIIGLEFDLKLEGNFKVTAGAEGAEHLAPDFSGQLGHVQCLEQDAVLLPWGAVGPTWSP